MPFSALTLSAAPAALEFFNDSGTAQSLEPVTVTGTREKALLSETPASVGAVSIEAVQLARPLHPGQVLGQIPGVAVAVTNGEGHTTAIRQPFTTSPVYLFLEDGIPTRATGFFNHNTLYEVNLPMSGGVEVVRGPGTALYGSDAIGGIINVLSKAPSTARPEYDASVEVGSFGTRRFLASASVPANDADAARLDANFTHTDGWRYRTAYDRQSVNARWDQKLSERSTLKALFGYSHIDQQTGANSPLTFADYLNNPTKNNMPIAWRKVNAARLSVEYEWLRDASMLSVIPYFRHNAMELNPTFTLSSDPHIENGENNSYGALIKFRQDFPEFMRGRVIVGVDADYSPGSRREDNILVTRFGSGADILYSAYTRGVHIYDYDVTYHSLSPYTHLEFSPTPALRVTAGARYDTFGFKLKNRLGATPISANVLGATRYYGQAPDTTKDYTRVSPKLGVTYAVSENTHVYSSHNYGFRGPSESQLFRPGSDSTTAGATNKALVALGLKPIKAVQDELGLRGKIAGFTYDLVAYQLVKRDDLVSQRDLATNVTTNVNAGKTRHRGVELGLGRSIVKGLRIDIAASYSVQRYVSWKTATADFSGKEIESAPHALGNARMTWTPTRAAMLQAEWARVGSYWLEASNSATFGKYAGHDLVNLRGSYAMSDHFSVFLRLMNAFDKRFADSASVSSNTRVFSPGLPRSFFGGVEARW